MTKKRRGRPRKTASRDHRSQPPAASVSPGEVLPLENAGALKRFTEKLKTIAGAQPKTVEGGQLPEQPASIPSTSSDGNFEATARETMEKYSPALEAHHPGEVSLGGDARGRSVADRPSDVAGAAPAAEVAPRHFVLPETVEAALKALTDAMAKQHGEHWRMSAEEKTLLLPVNIAMLDEQGPKWFGDLDNPAFWAWCLVMAGWIGTKSETVGKMVSAGIERLIVTMSGTKQVKP